MLIKDISGIILAGGKTSRMGTDKALLKLGDGYIISRITQILISVFTNVLIISDRLTSYEFLGIPIYPDIIKQKGPLSGIHSALVNSKTEDNFIITCDLPMISRDVIKYLLEYKCNKPIRYFFDTNKHHYFPGVYNKSILTEIEKIFSSRHESESEKELKYSIKNLVDKVSAEAINAEQLSFYYPEMFISINTPSDYEILLRLAESKKAT